MARTPGALLPLRGGVAYDFQDDDGVTPRLVAVQAPNRIDYLENRLAQQEKTSKGLMDRALKIKEDIIESLNFTQGTWQEEKYSREMLQEHIRTITAVVKRMGRDIEILEDQIKNRDGVQSGTSNAMKTLEMHHIAGQTDLRGRVARCDANIARLSADLRNCFESVKQVGMQVQDTAGKIYDKFNHMESKINDLNSKLDKTTIEEVMQIRRVDADASQNLTALDAKTRAVVEDTRNLINANRLHAENEREKLEGSLLAVIERTNAQRDSRYDKFEKAVDEWMKHLNGRVNKLEDESQKHKEKLVQIESHFEHRITNVLEINLKKQRDETARLKLECREGFGTVHESIANMKSVMDGKRRLLEEQMKREISAVRKMVVLI